MLPRLIADGQINSAELAQRTGTHERYVREWLGAQAAFGNKDSDTRLTVLIAEQCVEFVAGIPYRSP